MRDEATLEEFSRFLLSEITKRQFIDLSQLLLGCNPYGTLIGSDDDVNDYDPCGEDDPRKRDFTQYLKDWILESSEQTLQEFIVLLKDAKIDPAKVKEISDKLKVSEILVQICCTVCTMYSRLEALLFSLLIGTSLMCGGKRKVIEATN